VKADQGVLGGQSSRLSKEKTMPLQFTPPLDVFGKVVGLLLTKGNRAQSDLTALTGKETVSKIHNDSLEVPLQALSLQMSLCLLPVKLLTQQSSSAAGSSNPTRTLRKLSKWSPTFVLPALLYAACLVQLLRQQPLV
jgi:hypothetical protein